MTKILIFEIFSFSFWVCLLLKFTVIVLTDLAILNSFQMFCQLFFNLFSFLCRESFSRNFYQSCLHFFLVQYFFLWFCLLLKRAWLFYLVYNQQTRDLLLWMNFSSSKFSWGSIFFLDLSSPFFRNEASNRNVSFYYLRVELSLVLIF